MNTLTCKKLRCLDRWRCREKERERERISKRVKEREGDPHHLCYKCCTSVGGRLTVLRLTRSLSWVFISICSTISWSLNPWMRVTCQRRIFFLPLFLYFLLGQKAGVIETRHKPECEAFTAVRPHFYTGWKKQVKQRVLSYKICHCFAYLPFWKLSIREKRPGHWDGRGTPWIWLCKGYLVSAEETFRMGDACATFPGGLFQLLHEINK